MVEHVVRSAYGNDPEVKPKLVVGRGTIEISYWTFWKPRMDNTFRNRLVK